MSDDYKTRFTPPKKAVGADQRVTNIKPPSLFKEKMIRVGIVGSGCKTLKYDFFLFPCSFLLFLA
jgi:Fe-S cluster assembly iron-binding protein IscA